MPERFLGEVESEEGRWGVAGPKPGSADPVMDRTYDLELDAGSKGLLVHAVTNAPAEDVSMHGLQTPMNLQSWMGTNSVLMILPSITVFQNSPVKPCARQGWSVLAPSKLDTVGHAYMPICLYAYMPICPDAPMPRCPDAPMP